MLSATYNVPAVEDSQYECTREFYNGVSEILTEDNPAKLSGSIRNRNTFYNVTSCGRLAGETSSITIDGSEYCRNTRGLNFVIYDNYLMKVIDRVTFDTYWECRAAR